MAKVKSAASAFAVSLVILGLLFVGSTSLAILFYVQAQKAEADADSARIKLSTNMKPGDESKAAVVAAQAEAADGKLSLVGALAASVDKKENELKDSANKLKDKQDEVAQARGLGEKSTKEIEALKSRIETLTAETKAKIAAAEGNADQEKQAADKAKQEAQQKITHADEEVKTVQDAMAKASQDHQEALAAKDAAMSLKDKEFKEARAERDDLLRKLRDLHRPILNDVVTPVATVVDVLPSGDVVLNLGVRERVRPGLTFEVFQGDKVIHAEAGNIVSGKATIEVYTVGDHDAVARMVRGPKGLRLIKGDALVNLAFHPHSDLNFAVYGVFDINNTRNPNGEIEDESRIKALITSAGGKVLDFDTNNPQVILSPDIDYLVLGASPRLPIEPAGDEATDVAKVESYKRAQKTYALYNSLLAQARQMQVPVLNQNRFLELIGFYHRNKIDRPGSTPVKAAVGN